MKFKGLRGDSFWWAATITNSCMLASLCCCSASHPALELDEVLSFSLGYHWRLPRAWAARPTAPWGYPCKQEISKGLSSHSLEIANTTLQCLLPPGKSQVEHLSVLLQKSEHITAAATLLLLAARARVSKGSWLEERVFLPLFSIHPGHQCSGNARPRSAQSNAQALWIYHLFLTEKYFCRRRNSRTR